MTDHPDAPDPQRRGLLKKAAVGVTVAWVAPTIVSASAGGQQTSGQGTGGGLVLEFRCGDGVTFVVTIPAQYVNAGYYLAPAIDSDLDANYCDDPPTLLGIGMSIPPSGGHLV